MYPCQRAVAQTLAEPHAVYPEQLMGDLPRLFDVGGGAAMLTRLPIFNLALAPTQTALQRLMGSKDLG